MTATAQSRGASRVQMMAAGERLIAQKGPAGVSIREICAAAGQRNKMALQYHFGTLDGLIEEILAWRRTSINDQRAAMFRSITPSDTADTVRQLVRCEIVPLADTLHRPGHFLRFMANYYREHPYPIWLADITDAGSAALALYGRDLIRRTLSTLTDEQFTTRSSFAATLILETLARREAQEHDRATTTELDQFTVELVDACTAILLGLPDQQDYLPTAKEV